MPGRKTPARGRSRDYRHSGNQIVAEGEVARCWLNTEATADLADIARDRFIAKARDDLPDLLTGPISDFVSLRAQDLMQDHNRLRSASGSASRVTVEPVLPPDVIGLFVMMPGKIESWPASQLPICPAGHHLRSKAI